MFLVDRRWTEDVHKSRWTPCVKEVHKVGLTRNVKIFLPTEHAEHHKMKAKVHKVGLTPVKWRKISLGRREM